MSGLSHNDVVAAAREAPALESAALRRIVPAKRRIRVADLPRDFPVVVVLASRDFKVKYKQSLLGPLWLVFQPLALLAGFFIAFRGRAAIGGGIPYVVFALSGLMVWSFFQAAMTIGAASLITNFQLVRFTPCPRLAFPLAAIIASLPSLIVPALGTLVATTAAGVISARAVLLPLGFAWLFVLTLGIVGIASALAVRYRDIISALPFLLSVGLFLAPVAYPLTGLAPWLRTVIELNPLTGILEACRWMTISGYHPSSFAIWLSLILTTLLLLLGWRVFTRLETTMADEI